MKFGVGQAIPRLEDTRLLTGGGRYTDDLEPGEGLAVAFLRAPLAHSRLVSIDISGAASLDGVHLVATQADLDGEDRYGRRLVRLGIDGRDVGDGLIAEGLAVPYTGGRRIDWCDRLG